MNTRYVLTLCTALVIGGALITGSAHAMAPGPGTSASQVEVAKLESPPFSVIAAKTLKPSQNMYTETILWTLGEQSRMSTVSTGTSNVNAVAADVPASWQNACRRAIRAAWLPPRHRSPSPRPASPTRCWSLQSRGPIQQCPTAATTIGPTTPTTATADRVGDDPAADAPSVRARGL